MIEYMFSGAIPFFSGICGLFVASLVILSQIEKGRSKRT